MSSQILPRKRGVILSTAKRYGVRRVYLFGSEAREGRGQDLDLLVELSPERGLLDLAGLSCELEELLGCRVDVFTPELLKPSVRREALKEAVPL